MILTSCDIMVIEYALQAFKDERFETQRKQTLQKITELIKQKELDLVPGKKMNYSAVIK